MKKLKKSCLGFTKILIPLFCLLLALQVLAAGFVFFIPLVTLIDTALINYTPLSFYRVGVLGWIEGAQSKFAWYLIGFIPLTFLVSAVSLSVFIMYKGIIIYKGLTYAAKH